MARSIYEDYTDQVESFGLDECWLDVTGSVGLFGDGKHIADEIRRRIREEMGVTASIGVSFNKIFAKLGKMGQLVWQFANGLDYAPVDKADLPKET